MTERTCSSCLARIGPKSVSGRCQRCATKLLAADPEWRAKQRAGTRAKFDDPAHRAKHRAVLLERNANRTPAMIAAQREIGRQRAREVLSRPDMRAIVDDPAMKAENGRKGSATKLAWCPSEYRDEYRRLKASQRLRAAEARALVEQLVATDKIRAASAAADREAQRVAALTPLDRQLERLRAGARLFAVPVQRRGDPTLTLPPIIGATA